MDSATYKLLKTDDKTYLIDTYHQISVWVIPFHKADFWKYKADEIRFYVIDPVNPLAFETVGYMGEDRVQVEQLVHWYLQKTGRSFMTVDGCKADETIKVFDFFDINDARELGSRWFSAKLPEFIITDSLEAFKVELSYLNRISLSKIEYVQIPLEFAGSNTHLI